MKLHWFSPLPPTRTGIADYTAAILPALQEIADVTLWTDQPGWKDDSGKLGKVVHYNAGQMPWHTLNEADICIYNIGNHYIYHTGIWQVSRQHPGIVVLHDTMLHDLFYGMHKVFTKDKDAYLAQLEYHHGEAARHDGEDLWEGNSSIEVVGPKHPFTSLALENALGVVVHTDTAFEALEHSCELPIACLPQAASLPILAENGGTSPHLSSSDEVYRLIIFGHIGRNRRLETVLHALQSFKSRHRFHLHVYGELLESARIVALLKLLKLHDFVTLHGFVSDKELDEALNKSHIAINLRYPTMGEASFSQLQIWQHALPTLATPVGWYANLPGDIVAFVNPENEIADIHRHLNAFLSDPRAFKRMGEKGQRRLQEEHSPEAYAQAIKKFISETLELSHARPYRHDLSKKVASILGRWMPAGQCSGPFARVAGELLNLISTREQFIPAFEEGWYSEEMNPEGETWRWSSGDAAINLRNPSNSQCEATLCFELGSLDQRRVTILKDGMQILQTALSAETKRIENLAVTLVPGRNQLSFKTDTPPAFHSNSADPRPFGFVVRQFCRN